VGLSASKYGCSEEIKQALADEEVHLHWESVRGVAYVRSHLLQQHTSRVEHAQLGPQWPTEI